MEETIPTRKFAILYKPAPAVFGGTSWGITIVEATSLRGALAVYTAEISGKKWVRTAVAVAALYNDRYSGAFLSVTPPSGEWEIGECWQGEQV